MLRRGRAAVPWCASGPRRGDPPLRTNEGIVEGKLVGRIEGAGEGKILGVAEGEIEALRRLTLRVLYQRFGMVPPALVTRVEQGEASWCQELFDRAVGGAPLSDLDEEGRAQAPLEEE
jgi:hypothetical protein